MARMTIKTRTTNNNFHPRFLFDSAKPRQHTFYTKTKKIIKTSNSRICYILAKKDTKNINYFDNFLKKNSTNELKLLIKFKEIVNQISNCYSNSNNKQNDTI